MNPVAAAALRPGRGDVQVNKSEIECFFNYMRHLFIIRMIKGNDVTTNPLIGSHADPVGVGV